MNRILIVPVIATLFAASIAVAESKDGGPRGPMQADTNKDGVVTLDEAVAAAKARFAAADTNKDGKLSADEMKQMRPHGRHGGKGGHGPGQMFDRLDANKDGKLTRDELRAKSDEHFTKLDANKDGVVTREEAQKAHPPHQH